MSRAVFCALLFLVAGCRGTAPLVVPSAAVPAAIDGDASEWTTGLRPVPGETGLSLGLRNTPDALVVAIIAGDEWQARRIATGGLTLWLDPAGGIERRAGLRFPVGAGEVADVAEDVRPDNGSLRAAFGTVSERLATVRGDDVRPVAFGGVPGVETAAAWTAQGLVVEVRLPLRGTAAAAFAGEATGATVGLGVELAQVARSGAATPPPASMTGRSPDGRVDGYGADRRASGNETAAPQDVRAARASGFRTTWMSVALAP
ncbi:MAG TPA: hypothetical protein VF594_03840 [Rubricoccaceae bacterium]|jgi:hypothetical protein